MAFGQFLIAKPQSGNSDPVEILKSIKLFLTGETVIANMPAFTADVQTYIVNTVPAGWEFIREYTTGLPSTCVYGFTMRAPIDNSPGKFKYVTLAVQADGDVYIGTGDADSGGPVPNQTHGTTYTALYHMGHRLQISQSYFLNITASARHFLMFPQVTGSYAGPGGVVERTRLNTSWDTVDSDWCPAVCYKGTFQGAAGFNFRNSMDPTSKPNNTAPIGYIGVMQWYNSQASFNAVYDVSGTKKYFMYQPKFAFSEVELGMMHPSVPAYAIGTIGTGDDAVPSKTVGATVKIGADDYIVWNNQSFVATATYPIYIRKE